MEIGIDRNEWNSRTGAKGGAAPEWHALRARFAASHAARHVVSRARQRFAREGQASAMTARGQDREWVGSFSARSATLLAAQNKRLSVVNPKSSGHSKCVSRMVYPFAGTLSTGGRGQG